MDSKCCVIANHICLKVWCAYVLQIYENSLSATRLLNIDDDSISIPLFIFRGAQISFDGCRYEPDRQKGKLIFTLISPSMYPWFLSFDKFGTDKCSCDWLWCGWRIRMKSAGNSDGINDADLGGGMQPCVAFCPLALVGFHIINPFLKTHYRSKRKSNGRLNTWEKNSWNA